MSTSGPLFGLSLGEHDVQFDENHPSSKPLHCVVNGALVPADKAVLYINDLSIQRGYGIFDFFKTVNGRPVFLDDHLDRLYHSAGQMRLDAGRSRVELKELLAELMERNNQLFSGIRITLTGGYSNDGYTMGKPNMIITQQPLALNNNAEAKGIRLVTYQHQRQMPQVKTIDYLMAIWLQPFIKEQQADEVLYHYNNQVTECPRANFYIITKEGKIATPANNLLTGVIRKQLLRHFTAAFMIEERDISISEVYEAKEAFITSTTKDILPVFSVDGRQIGNGKRGEITMRLAGRLKELVNDAG